MSPPTCPPGFRTSLSRISRAAAATGVTAVLAAAAVTPAFAQAQVQASRESCATLQNLVQRQGRVVIGTGPYLYDTYVNNCAPRQSQVPAYLATRDNPQCFVGYSCGQGND
ncbi:MULTISPECIES: hypothetical protein [unclassified Chelatococcus]|uniref:hypothetical protein n=1 Tax=unclassified Chelatococcus TaxID=2638111 RepID=UPI0020BECD01|nr:MULTISPECIES: hypothetical protein [unclassified Chelatococcus]MCO5079495.1 hypothetical protein [Chelatococcus sp.]